ncbi:NACHT domain-containing protein [Thermogemmatispora sp.]|uniref:NACHT domain-containing protein n=1 Tax=Thermogemmatispora sp. TaxID=1968838 RepID=UPI0035E4445F
MSDTTRLPRYSSNIRSERELRGWSQARLAEELGTTPGTVSNWERGIIMPSAYFRERLCQVFAKDAVQLGLVAESQEALPAPPLERLAEAGLPSLQRGWSNRARLMEKVALYWLHGVLEPSLRTLPDLRLCLAWESGAVASLVEDLPGSSCASAGPLPEGTSLLDCYDEALGELLLLGEPGAGKTTLLLSLLRELLRRASDDERHPLPVVFPLASWARRQPPLEDWLLQELQRLYQVPSRLGRAWLQAEQILPLLDGLDEVPAQQRSACIRAINAYRREHGLLPLVVTCRSDAYYAQPERLSLQGAVAIQGLTPAYVRAYLARHSEADERSAVLACDPSLLEMITSPLLLSIAREMLVSRGKKLCEVKEGSWQGEQLLWSYSERLMARSQRRYGLTPARLRRWLGWLAQQLLGHSQAAFLLDQLQASWLPARSWGRRCWKPLTGALWGLVFGLASALLFTVVLIGPFSTFEAAHTYLGPGLLAGLVTGLATCALRGACPWKVRGQRALLAGGSFALVFGLALGPAAGLVFGLLGGLLAWSGIIRHFGGRIELTEAPTWSGRLLCWRLKRFMPLLLASLALCGFILTTLTLLVGRTSLATAVSAAFLVLLFLCVAGAFVGSFLGGLSWSTLAEPKFLCPAEGIWRAGRYALIYGLSAIVIALVLLLVAIQLFAWLCALLIALLTGPLPFVSLPDTLQSLLPETLALLFPCIGIGLALAWNSGGAAWLQHLLLRLFLFSAGCLPLRAVHYLEIAVAEGLLRRAGGAYLFSHRLLLEHFAAIAEEKAVVCLRQQAPLAGSPAIEKPPS